MLLPLFPYDLTLFADHTTATSLSSILCHFLNFSYLTPNASHQARMELRRLKQEAKNKHAVTVIWAYWQGTKVFSIPAVVLVCPRHVVLCVGHIPFNCVILPSRVVTLLSPTIPQVSLTVCHIMAVISVLDVALYLYLHSGGLHVECSFWCLYASNSIYITCYQPYTQSSVDFSNVLFWTCFEGTLFFMLLEEHICLFAWLL